MFMHTGGGGNSESEQDHKQCVDSQEECQAWAREGECENNPAFMWEACPKSCERCSDRGTQLEQSLCEDGQPECSNWAQHGECDRNSDFMLQNCKLSCRVCTPEPQGDAGEL